MSKSNRTLINGPAFGFPFLTITAGFLLRVDLNYFNVDEADRLTDIFAPTRSNKLLVDKGQPSKGH